MSVWLSVDPLASKYPSLSPYAYCANNPVLFVDIKGKDIEIVWISRGKDPTEWFGHVAINMTGNNVKPVDLSDIQGKSGNRYYTAGGGMGNYSNPEVIVNPSGNGGAYETTPFPLLDKDISEYKSQGRTIEKVVFKLPDNVEIILNQKLADLYKNPGSESHYGSYCGDKIYNLLLSAFIDAGYSEEDAGKYVNNIMPGTIPSFTNTNSNVWQKGNAASSYTIMDKNTENTIIFHPTIKYEHSSGKKAKVRANSSSKTN